jgi:hypothetical protein
MSFPTSRLFFVLHSSLYLKALPTGYICGCEGGTSKMFSRDTKTHFGGGERRLLHGHKDAVEHRRDEQLLVTTKVVPRGEVCVRRHL